MRRQDPNSLYSIFEHHLFNSLIEEETAEDFVHCVATEYLDRLKSSGSVIQRAHHDSVHEEIREQVLEMLRKKTYGHFSLEHFRKSQPVENSQTVVVQNAPSQAPTKARVKGRA